MTYTLTVEAQGRSHTVSASAQQILIDHLEASAGRFGWSVFDRSAKDGRLPYGDIMTPTRWLGCWHVDEEES